MRCADCRTLLHACADGELPSDQNADVRSHLDSCAECAAAFAELQRLRRLLKEDLVRYAAPDALEARIREAITAPASAGSPRAASRMRRWGSLAAACITVAALSSALTAALLRRDAARDAAEEAVLSSHIRSLMPGHLTDVASTDQHNVKPWFDGRVDLSPPVPRLDSAGFPLIGGRLDYLDGHAAAVIVYGRRLHVINVYTWPVARRDVSPERFGEHGYHLVRWTEQGVEFWAVSDVNGPELDAFVADFRRSR